MSYLSVCAIAKNEAPYLEEWVEFHRLVGVEHFYLYDNSSSVPIRETLKKQISEGWVSVIEFAGVAMQLPAYNHGVNQGLSSKWIAFIDIDEFLFPTVGDDLRIILEEFEAHGAVVVNWVTFGSSGHLQKPHGLQIDNFRMRQPDASSRNELIKSIVRPQCVSKVLHPHCFQLKAGFDSVNERHQRVPYSPVSTPPSLQKLRINHYYTRSHAEFLEKMGRGRVSGGALLTPKEFDEADALCTVEDRTILRFSDRLRKAL